MVGGHFIHAIWYTVIQLKYIVVSSTISTRYTLDNATGYVIMVLVVRNKFFDNMNYGYNFHNKKGITKMKTITGQGFYKIKDTGTMQEYGFDYASPSTLQEAIELLSEAKVLSLVQRMIKVDASNTSREKAKAANGHSVKKVMSEEEKAANKAARAKITATAKAISGLSAEQIEDLPESVRIALGY